MFPPHCVKGTAGAELVPEALTEKVARVPNDAAAKLPEDLSQYQQVLLEKQTLNIFESRHAADLLLGFQAYPPQAPKRVFHPHDRKHERELVTKTVDSLLRR